MLVFAKQYEEAWKSIARSICLDEKYRWYNTGYIYIPNFDDTDWDNIRRLSLTEDGKIIGYFNAAVDRTNLVITNVAMWSVASTYKEYKTFELDLLKFIKSLFSFYSIQFTVTIGNPVQQKYRKFVKMIGGDIVGIRHNCLYIEGERYDERYRNRL